MKISESTLRGIIRKTIAEQSGKEGILLPALPFVDRTYNPITNILGRMPYDTADPSEDDSLSWLQSLLEKIPQGHGGICLTDSSGNVTLYEFGRYEKESSYKESGCGDGEPRIQFGLGLWVDAVVKATPLGNFKSGLMTYRDDGRNKIKYFSEEALQQIGSKIEGSGYLFQCLNFNYSSGMSFINDFGIGVCREYTVWGTGGGDNCGTFVIKALRAGGVNANEVSGLFFTPEMIPASLQSILSGCEPLGITCKTSF